MFRRRQPLFEICRQMANATKNSPSTPSNTVLGTPVSNQSLKMDTTVSNITVSETVPPKKRQKRDWKRRKPKKSKSCETATVSDGKKDAPSAIFPFAGISDRDFASTVGCEEAAAPKRPKIMTQRPNYFVAIPITNQEICDKLAEIQTEIVKSEPLLKSAMINPVKSHLTLHVMHLDELHCVHTAENALKQALSQIQSDRDLVGTPLTLPFDGVSTFTEGANRGKVIFTQIKPGPHLKRLHRITELVRDAFAAAELFSTDTRTTFVPHLTIAKLSKDPQLFKKLKVIKPVHYDRFTDTPLGLETVKTLQICAMMRPQASNGYYFTPIELPLVVDVGTSSTD